MGKISIGGKEFFGSAEFMLDADTVTSDQPGDDSSFITDMGVGPLTIRVKGDCTEETDSLSDVRKEIMTVGELSLILDSGWKYKVFRRSFRPVRIAGTKQTGLNGYHNMFDAMFVCEEPYQFTTTDNTRSKAITANNETWAADDSGNALSTDGEVDAVPDIQVTGESSTTASKEVEVTNTGGTARQVESAHSIKGQTFTPMGTTLTKVVFNCSVVGTAGDVVLTVWDSISMNNSRGSKTVNITGAGAITFLFASPINMVDTKPYLRFTTSSADVTFTSANSDAYSLGEGKIGDAGNFTDMTIEIWTTYLPTIDPVIYNTADTTTKCYVANDMLVGAIHRINVDGTGTIDYDDDFTGFLKFHVNSTWSGVTYDATNDELDIADDGYVYWDQIDTKYPITGIPTLTAQINNTAATLPTIQISTDAATWYDIDTAVVDDVDTEYELDDSTNLSLKGRTSFYFRIDCVAAAVVQGCSVKSLELDVDIVTIDAENPVITEGGSASTFRCDQDAASGMSCEISLIYADRKWPG